MEGRNFGANSKQFTLTSALNTIKRRLGMRFWKLPFPDADRELMDIIKDETLVTFSAFFPHKVKFKYNLLDNRVPGEHDTFFIDTAQLGDATIVSVEDVVLDSFYENHFPYHSPANSFELFADMTMAANYEAMLSLPIVTKFDPPNKLIIEDCPVNLDWVYIELNIVHPDNLSTIKITYREEFIKLALVDIKIFLYNELKHYDKVDTTFGQIDLKIDEWQQAEDERKNIIEEWGKSFLSTRSRKIYKV